MKETKLPPTYFQQQDVVSLAKDLVGKTIHTNINNELCVGIVSETEAYAGVGDKACHAHLGRFTKRTQVMYEPGGIAYVYLCYGIHHLFNIVCNQKGIADAILIRGVIPIKGVETILKRRNKTKTAANLCSGPGNFTQAFGITKTHNTQSVCEDVIWLENNDIKVSQIKATPRIGIDYAEEDALLPWRFVGEFSNTKHQKNLQDFKF
jgi:DNA-3-methyladenine glycosylase